LHSNYTHTGASLSHHVTSIVCEIACHLSLMFHIHRKPLRCTSAPFVIVETWDEDDPFPYWEKRVPCPRTRRVVPNLVVSYSAVVPCAKSVGAHVTACLIDMLKLSTFRTLRILQFCVEGRLAVRLPSLFWRQLGIPSTNVSVSSRGGSEVREDEAFTFLRRLQCPTTRSLNVPGTLDSEPLYARRGRTSKRGVERYSGTPCVRIVY
jgi:hypothetical protein